MPRWRQCSKTNKLIPIDDAARALNSSAVVHGDISPFVSPVDGTVVADRKQLREHNLRNNVVNANEFPPEFYAQKAKERASFYEGQHSKKESLKRKQEIYEAFMRAERR